jgi:hypothetical protein
MKYSPSTGGFYPEDQANTTGDTVEVTDASYAALFAAQAAGQVIVAGPGGQPVAQAPAAPTLTLAEQAAAMIAAGVTIVSTATPALNGVYACDPTSQAKMGNMYNLIMRAGGTSFPGSLAALPWPDISNYPTKARTFTVVSDFLNFEQAVGDWVLTLNVIMTTGVGTLPSATVTIP